MAKLIRHIIAISVATVLIKPAAAYAFENYDALATVEEAQTTPVVQGSQLPAPPVAPTGANELAEALRCSNHNPNAAGAFERWVNTATQWLDINERMIQHSLNLQQYYARQLQASRGEATSTPAHRLDNLRWVDLDPAGPARLEEIRMAMNMIFADLDYLVAYTSPDRNAPCMRVDTMIEKMKAVSALNNQHWQAIENSFRAASNGASTAP